VTTLPTKNAIAATNEPPSNIFLDGNSIVTSLQSCSRDETRDDDPALSLHHYDYDDDEDEGDDDDEEDEDDDADEISLHDNISLNNYIPWRIKAAELLQPRLKKKNDPPPLFFKTLSVDDCSTTATKTVDGKSNSRRSIKDNSNHTNKQRRQQPPQPDNIAFVDDVSSRVCHDEDSSAASTPQSSTLSQTTIDPSLLDNYSFVQFERNFCMDLAAANVGGGNNSTKYDQQVMQRFQEMKERRMTHQQQLRLRESQLGDGAGDTHNERQQQIKFMEKSEKGRKRHPSGGNKPMTGGGGGTAPTMGQTWSVEGLVDSVSRLWS
jgi:hypothetical protein